MKNYIFDRFKNSKKFKKELLETLKNLSNIEFGGRRLNDGHKNHITQNPYEITELIFFLKAYEKTHKMKLKKFLEIGFYTGFTNTILNKFFNFEHIVVVDNLSDQIDGNNFLANLKFKSLTLITGSSTAKSTIKKVKNFSSYDLIFIDGNHSYQYVKKDFENYCNYLSKKGIIIFHDIINKDWPGVRKLFNEIKLTKKFHTHEITSHGNKINYGLGLVIKK
tara:strand:- start:35 stop:697 length:663 start_codon:yes stop_codon:yes gene_type:complete